MRILWARRLWRELQSAQTRTQRSHNHSSPPSIALDLGILPFRTRSHSHIIIIIIIITLFIGINPVGDQRTCETAWLAILGCTKECLNVALISPLKVIIQTFAVWSAATWISTYISKHYYLNASIRQIWPYRRGLAPPTICLVVGATLWCRKWLIITNFSQAFTTQVPTWTRVGTRVHFAGRGLGFQLK